MSDGESCAEPVVLDDGTAVLAAHRPQLGQAKGVAVVTGRRRVAANVLPAKKSFENQQANSSPMRFSVLQ